MLCKYYLQIGSDTVVVGSDNCYDVSDCVANAVDFTQSFVRKDYGGVTRKYGSSIKLMGLGYELLVGLYRSQYLDSHASFALYVVNNNWEYEEAWQCPLDFSSFAYDRHKASINCIDNSAAALIKANGGTKSSYSVAALKSTEPLHYDRVYIPNALKMMFSGKTQEGTLDTLWAIEEESQGFYFYSTVPLSVLDTSGVSDDKFTCQTCERVFYNPYINVGHDISRVMEIQGYSTYFLKAGNDGAQVTLDMSNVILIPTEVKTYSTGGGWLDPNKLPYAIDYYLAAWNDDGDFKILAHSNFSNYGAFIPFGGRVSVYLPAGYKLTLIMQDGYWDEDMKEGDTYYWRHLWFMYMSSLAVTIKWDSRGDAIDLDVIEPLSLLNRILRTVADDKMLLYGMIDSTAGGSANSRLAGLKMLSAESVRGFDGAQIHTSFNEFCKFMEAEFGYVYRLDDGIVDFDGFVNHSDIEDDHAGTITDGEIPEKVFFLVDDDSSGIGGFFVGYHFVTSHYYYANFPTFGTEYDYPLYRNRSTGKVYCYDAEAGTLTEQTYSSFDFCGFVTLSDYQTADKSEGEVYYITDADVPGFYLYRGRSGGDVVYDRRYFCGQGGTSALTPAYSVRLIPLPGVTYRDGQTGQCYHHDVSSGGLTSGVMQPTAVRFLHRCDLFGGEVVREVSPSGGVEFRINDDLLYSGVNVGYEKQDYESNNTGRDEWNFENYYQTGVALKDQKLELVCPYRADCYGIEELVGKRGGDNSDKETTDSDEDVWLVKCLSSPSDGRWQIDRTLLVSGAYTNSVFNAALAPIYMVEANAHFLASFCHTLKLSMTRGSRDIVIDGMSVTKDFDFSGVSRLFKAGLIKVLTDRQDLPDDLSGLLSLEMDGYRYTGYIRSVELKYQREEAVGYELIEHSQEEI